MNIFLFDPLDFSNQASIHPDKLVVKMQLEATQLLNNSMGNPIPKLDGSAYKKTHVKHPCSIWISEKNVNFWYCYRYLESLVVEYEKRYNKPSNYRLVLDFIKENKPYYTEEFPEDYAIAINEFWLKIFYQDGLITARELTKVFSSKRANADLARKLYQNYLLYAKNHYAEYQYSEIPEFWCPREQRKFLSEKGGKFCKLKKVSKKKN